MAGMSREAGSLLAGWLHVEQSIHVILTTPIGSRPMRRTFGSRIPFIIDNPMNERTLLDIYVEAARALDMWEPRFRLERVVSLPAQDGSLRLNMPGLFIPDGHKRPRDSRLVGAKAASTTLVFTPQDRANGSVLSLTA